MSDTPLPLIVRNKPLTLSGVLYLVAGEFSVSFENSFINDKCKIVGVIHEEFTAGTIIREVCEEGIATIEFSGSPGIDVRVGFVLLWPREEENYSTT